MFGAIEVISMYQLKHVINNTFKIAIILIEFCKVCIAPTIAKVVLIKCEFLDTSMKKITF